MDTFFLNELKSCCVDINGDRENAGGISGVMDAYRRIMDFSELARQEGLLALCDACDKLDKSDRTQGFLFRLMRQVVDGDAKRDAQRAQAKAMMRKAHMAFKAADQHDHSRARRDPCKDDRKRGKGKSFGEKVKADNGEHQPAGKIQQLPELAFPRRKGKRKRAACARTDDAREGPEQSEQPEFRHIACTAFF